MVGTMLVGSAVAFGVLVLAETLFPPMAGPALPIAGMSVAAGDVSLATAVSIATVASTVGAVVLYHAAGAVGSGRVRDMRRPLGDGSRAGSARFDRAEDWFRRHSDAAVLFGRCIPVVRSLVSIPAGLGRMPLLRFVALTTVGNLIWCTAVISAASVAGDRVDLPQRSTSWVQAVVLGIWAVVAVVALYARRVTAADAPNPPT